MLLKVAHGSDTCVLCTVARTASFFPSAHTHTHTHDRDVAQDAGMYDTTDDASDADVYATEAAKLAVAQLGQAMAT